MGQLASSTCFYKTALAKTAGKKKQRLPSVFLFEPLRRPDRDSIWPLGWYPLTLGG